MESSDTNLALVPNTGRSYRGQNISGNAKVQLGDDSKELETDLFVAPKASNTGPRPSFNVPFASDSNFVNQEEILSKVKKGLSQPPRRIALFGLGGVGKSQIAIEYSHQEHRSRPDQQWVFWIYCGTAARFNESFQIVAEQLDLPWREEPKRVLWLVKRWLERHSETEWLLVLDSADDSDVFFARNSLIDDGIGLLEGKAPLSEYIPWTNNGSILITSRNKDLALRLVGDAQNIISIDPMEEDSALQLLKNKTKQMIDPALGRTLVSALDCMPLAITQAAAYINQREPRISVSSYIKTLGRNEANQLRLLMLDAGDVRRDGRRALNSIILSWHISFEQVRREKKVASDLLSLMSLFDHEGIPEKLLRMEFGDRPVETTESDDSNNADFEDDIDILRKYCLINIGRATSTTKQAFEMHRLVQPSTRKWLDMRRELELWKCRYIRLLARAFPQSSPTNWATCQALLPHVLMLVKQQPEDQTLAGAWITTLTRAGTYASSVGKYHTSATLYKAALKVQESIFGMQFPATLLTATRLAVALLKHGDFRAAEDLIRKTVDGYTKMYGEEHPQTLKCLNKLAVVLRSRADYKQAEVISNKAIQRQEEALGPTHPDFLASLSDLAELKQRQGRMAEAEAVSRKCLEEREKVLGKMHQDTLTSVNQMGIMLRKQGKYIEAEVMSIRAWESRKELLGSGHPATLASMSELGLVTERRGKYEEAELLSRQCLEGREVILGLTHPSTLTSMNNLSAILRQGGCFLEAERIGKQALEGREKSLGHEHSDTLFSVSNLGLILQRQGKLEEAKALHERALKARKRLRGHEHPSALTSANNLAAVLRDLGDCQRSEEITRQVLKSRRQVLGNTHADTLVSVTNLALLLQRKGNLTEASALNKQALNARRQTLGKEHPATLTSAHILASVFWEQGNLEQARELYQQALVGRTRVLGPQHPSTLRSSEDLEEITKSG